MTKKAESRLQLKIRHALEGQFPGSYWWKVHGGPFTPAGVPDLAGVVLGRAAFVEVKIPGGRVSRIQTITQQRLASAGAIVAVATSVDEAVTQVRAGLASPAPTLCGYGNPHCTFSGRHMGSCSD